MKSFREYLQLGPEATKRQDKAEITRQKAHLTNKAHEYHAISAREGGGGAAKAKGDSFLAAKENIKEDGMGGGAMSAAPTNTTGSGNVAGMGQPPGSKSGEPGVGRKKRSPVLSSIFKRKPPKM